MAPKVSILMPSLNVRDYITQCMESVLNQTLTDIEIICIDAGSKDGTLEILREYERNDSRVKLILSDKKSYGHQMNLGLRAAHGDYIGIVETDDWASVDMFEVLWHTANEQNADLVKANYYWYTTSPEEVDRPFESLATCRYHFVFAGVDSFEFAKATPAIWSGIYRRKMLLENDIWFNETPGASYQDTSFHLMTCAVAKRVYLLPDYLLHYRRDNADSSVNSSGKVFCICDEADYFEEFLSKRPMVAKRFEKQYYSIKYDKYRWNYDRIPSKYQWEFLVRMKEEFENHLQNDDLEARWFSTGNWDSIHLLVSAPFTFYKKSCKYYSDRPVGSALPQPKKVVSSAQDLPDVSVIIPVYNNVEYIRDCISSVFANEHVMIEAVCVDDGSSDASIEAMLELASSNTRLTILKQENEGQSSARNHALAVAKGRFVVFLDSDDSLRPGALDELVSQMEATQAEIIYFDAETIYETESLKRKFPSYENAYKYEFSDVGPVTGVEYFTRAIEEQSYRVSACMAVYRREFLSANDIRFLDGILHEDNVFTFCCLLHAHSVLRMRKAYYRRTLRNGSTMTMDKTFSHVYGYLECINQIKAMAFEHSVDQRFADAVATELMHLTNSLRGTYNRITDKQTCLEHFTALERYELQKCIDSGQLAIEKRRLARERKKLNDVKSSLSYRIGRKITLPPRIARAEIRSLKRDGVRRTLVKSIGLDNEWKSSDPKVLFVSSDAYRMSGAFLSLVALNKLLNNIEGETTHVILPYYGSGTPIIKKEGVSNSVIKSSDWIIPIKDEGDSEEVELKKSEEEKNLLAAARIAKYALDHDFNIIHSNTTYTYVGAIAAQIAGLPHIWHLREYLEEDQGKQIYDKKRGYKLISRTDRVVAISESLADKYRALLPKADIRVIYNGVDVNKYYMPEKMILQKERPVFLFVSGSDSPNKGRAHLIKACSILKSKGYLFDLWFVGWCGHELRNAVIESGLLENTKFFGYRHDTEYFYERADFFFMCSRFEAFGRTTVEAGMSGCLVFGADAGGTTELIDHEKTGYLYPYGDYQELVRLIELSLCDVERSRAIAASGREYYFSNFTAEKNAHSIFELHTEVVQRSKPKTSMQKKLAYMRIAQIEREYKREEEAKSKSVNETGDISVEETVGDYNKKMMARIAQSDQIAVSIVVPVYNVSQYLRQCLDSIANQSLISIEVLCVNDGSTDGSLDIIKEYCEKDIRFKCIDKENGGYGSAVNAGIDSASGLYIGIVEPDDFIEKEMYEQLLVQAVRNGMVDIVKSSYWLYYDEVGDEGGKRIDAPILAACHPPKAVFDVWDYPEIVYHHPSIWSCIYRTDFLRKKAIRFVEAPGAGWVDNPFLLETFCQADTIVWTPEAYYCYRQTNPDASSNVKDCSMPFRRTKEMLAFLDRMGIYDSEVRGSVYKRILYNAAEALANRYYSPEKDEAIISEQMGMIDKAFLSEKRVRERERVAYNHFIAKGYESLAGNNRKPVK